MAHPDIYANEKGFDVEAAPRTAAPDYIKELCVHVSMVISAFSRPWRPGGPTLPYDDVHAPCYVARWTILFGRSTITQYIYATISPRTDMFKPS